MLTLNASRGCKCELHGYIVLTFRDKFAFNDLVFLYPRTGDASYPSRIILIQMLFIDFFEFFTHNCILQCSISFLYTLAP
jgi:hypothetical protein